LGSPVLHINPDELNDISSLRTALFQALNLIETQSQQINELRKIIQELRDENNRLKGEQGKPNILPNTKPDISSQKHIQEHKPWNKQRKKDIIQIDNQVICPVDKKTLPMDVEFKGYDTVIGQNIIFQRNNTGYKVEIWYSPSQHKTYRGNLPESYTGYFGTNLKAFCLMMNYGLDITRNKLLDFIRSIGIEMSVGSLENILTANTVHWLQEKNDLLKAGLQGTYLQTDSTSARVHGKNHRTHVFISEFIGVFATMPGKSRLDILCALQGQPEEGILLQWNSIALTFFEHYKIAPDYCQQVEALFQEKQNMGINEFETLATNQLPKLKSKTTTYKWVIESLAFGYYFEQTMYRSPEVLVSDDAREYALLAPYRMLCWIHDARFYNKLTPVIDCHRIELEKFQKRYWKFYGLLKQYKQNPTQELKLAIVDEFDETFTPNTTYFDLNQEIDRTRYNKKFLLTVLDHPQIPLHNNASELGARRQVRKRDISLHTMTELGTKLQDAFMSIIHTSSLMGVNAFQYILDRINNCSPFYLPDLVLDQIKLQQKK
jgi:hypothetical protein